MPGYDPGRIESGREINHCAAAFALENYPSVKMVVHQLPDSEIVKWLS